ncbi:MAG: RNA polymerase subunit sigma, partial [Acidobacteria bacterium]|nr:RNA polymerase subunit sigma [Candidatus Polarisedimenticola svalbardensis]
RAIRRVLVDHARHRLRLKRGAGAPKLPLEFAENLSSPEPTTDLVALDDALSRLKEQDELKCKIVEMRFFGGLNNKEIAEVIGTSSRTVERHWRYSKAWLFRELTGSVDDE